jgi:feruloyl esterase
MHAMNSRALCATVTALVAMLLAPSAIAQTQASSTVDCTALANMKIPNTNLLSAALVPAAEGLPEYCRVLGYVRPAINFEIRLPAHGWNGKFYMAGCGGFCGTLDSDRPGQINAMNHGLTRKYAVSTMDGGHWGTAVTDGRWGFDNPVARADWGYRAVTETARVSKLVIETFYKAAPTKSYFHGCSNGGRQAQMEASRFPDDFDGIISGAPALDLTGLAGALHPWLTQADTGGAGRPIFSTSKRKLVEDAVAKACAGPDGLIEDPRTCPFKPASLKCTEGDGSDCLSAAEAGVLEKWYGGPKSPTGEQLYPGGIPLGSEPFWPTWLLGNGELPGAVMIFAREYVRYLAFVHAPGETYQVSEYHLERDLSKARELSSTYDSASPDLSKFKEKGRKLLMYQGWADAIVTPFRTVNYYEAVEKAMDGQRATEASRTPGSVLISAASTLSPHSSSGWKWVRRRRAYSPPRAIGTARLSGRARSAPTLKWRPTTGLAIAKMPLTGSAPSRTAERTFCPRAPSLPAADRLVTPLLKPVSPLWPPTSAPHLGAAGVPGLPRGNRHLLPRDHRGRTDVREGVPVAHLGRDPLGLHDLGNEAAGLHLVVARTHLDVAPGRRELGPSHALITASVSRLPARLITSAAQRIA